MSLRRKTIKGVLWSGVRNTGAGLISTLAFLLLARLLAPGEFGLVAYATVFTSFLAILQRQGFAQALVQRRELEPRHLDTAFWASAGAGGLLAGATIAAAPLVARTVGQMELARVLQALSAVLVIDALGTTARSLLRRRMEFRSLAVRSLLAAAVGGVVGVTMAGLGLGVWSLVGQQLAASAAGTVTLWKAAGWTPRLRVSARHFRDLFGFGAFAMGNEILVFFTRRTPDLLIGLVLGVEALGFYTLGARLVLMITRMFTNTVASVTLPMFSRIQHDHAQMRQALLTATALTSLLAAPAFFGLLVLAPDLVPTLFGARWAPSAPILQVVALFGVLRSVTFFNVPVILACGRSSWAFALALAGALTSVAAILIAVRGGVVWVAAAFTLHAWAFAPLPVLLVHRLIGLDVRRYLGQAAGPLAAGLIMAAAVGAFLPLAGEFLPARPPLAAAVLGGAGVYALAIRLLAPGRLGQLLDYARTALSAAPPAGDGEEA